MLQISAPSSIGKQPQPGDDLEHGDRRGPDRFCRRFRQWPFSGHVRTRRSTRKLDAAIDAYQRLVAGGLAETPEPEPLPLPHRALRRTIFEVLEAAGEELPTGEIQVRVEHILARPISKHSVVASLSAAVKDQSMPITKVAPGRYRSGAWRNVAIAIADARDADAQ